MKPDLLPRPLPANADAEKSVAGAILLSSSPEDDVRELQSKGGETLFFHVLPRLTFQAYRKLASAGIPITLQSLTEAMKREGWLDAVGGVAGLGELIGYRSILASDLAVLVDLAQRREAIKRANHTISLLYEANESAEKIIQGCNDEFEKITSNFTARERRTGASVWESAKDKLRKLWSGEIQRIKTGLPSLDRAIIGLEPGELVLLAGLRGSGKSALAVNIATSVLKTQAHIAFTELEMMPESLLLRAVSAETSTDLTRIRTGEMAPAERQSVELYEGGITSERLHFIEPKGFKLTLEDLWAELRYYKRRHGISLAILDYLQLIHTTGQESKAERVNAIAAGLKRIAMSLEIPLLVLCGMNRSAEKENREPQLSDLDYGGEKDADQVWMLHDPKDDTPRRQLFLRKMRQAEGDVMVELFFDKYRTAFHEMHRDHASARTKYMDEEGEIGY